MAQKLWHGLSIVFTRRHALCNVPVQSQPIIWVHVDEVDSVTYLRMLRSHYAIAANYTIVKGQPNAQLRSFFHRK